MKSIIMNIISRIGNAISFFRRKEIHPGKIRKMLVISLYFKGDVLFNTPAIRMLKKILPDATIDVLVKSRSKDVLEGNPDINSLIVFDKIRTADYKDSSGLNLKEKYALLKKLRKENYDLCIDLTGKYSTGLIALLGKFDYSFGINYNGFGFCYSKHVKINTQKSEGHLTQKYLDIIREGMGKDKKEWDELNRDFTNSCNICLSPEDIEAAESKLKSLGISRDRPLICIQATAGWKAKEWSEKNYSDLVAGLIRADYSFVLIGGGEDRDHNFRILDQVSRDLRKYFLSLPLKVNAAVIMLSDVFVGSDSIGLHLAGAVRTPSVGLFGPTNPSFSGPEGEMHNVIYKKLYCSAPFNEQYCTRDAGKSCPTIDCMKNIKTKEVMDNVDFLLSRHFQHKRITA